MLLSAQWYKNRCDHSLYPTLQQQSTEGKSLLSENKSTVRTYNIVSVTKLKLVLFGTNSCVTFLNINKVSDSLVAKILWYSNSTYCQRILNLPLSITVFSPVKLHRHGVAMLSKHIHIQSLTCTPHKCDQKVRWSNLFMWLILLCICCWSLRLLKHYFFVPCETH